MLCHFKYVFLQTTVYYTGKSTHTKTTTYCRKTSLKQLEEWASNWDMWFNTKKCYILSLKMKSRKNYTLNNNILEQVTSNPILDYKSLKI